MPRQTANTNPSAFILPINIKDKPQIITNNSASIRDFVIPNLSNRTPPQRFPNIENSPNREATNADPKVNTLACSNICKYGINCNAIPPTYNPTNTNDIAKIQKYFILLTSAKVYP